MDYGALLFEMESFVAIVNAWQSLVAAAKLSNLYRYHMSRNILSANLRLML